MVWRCACDLDIIVRLFLSLFPHCELGHFFTSIYRQWVSLVSATPPTVLYRSFWNFAYVFYMVRRCACGLGIIVRTFLSLFPHCELSHFSPSVYRQWVPLVSATPLTVLYWSFWNFAYVFFMAWGCACVLVIIVRLSFVTFFHIANLVIFHPLYVNSWYLLWAQLLL